MTAGRPPSRPPEHEPPGDDECGPAMRVLTPQSRAFVIAMLETGRGFIAGSMRGGARAAMSAGIGGNENSAHVWASRALRNPKIIAAMKEEAEKRLHTLPLSAISRLAELIESKDEGIALKATVAALDRTGFMAAVLTKVEHTHEVRISTDDLVQRIRERATRLNLPMPEEIEGEFVEVSSEGLEDVLA